MAITADALYRPVTSWVKSRRIQVKLGLIPVLGLWAALAIGLGLWLALVDDPRGGEPLVRLNLPAPAAVAERAPSPDEGGDEAAQAHTRGEQAPAEDRSQVKIITPGGQSGQGQIRIIDVSGTQASRALRAAPEPRLVEKSRHGLLPRIAPDGTKPSAFYARPFNPQTTTRSIAAPRIAILIGGLGLSVTSTNEAIAKLPPEMTFAFAPYGNNLQGQVNKARADGHEVMLHMPMEPFDFPSNDPGPQTLLTALSPDQNLDRLHWAMTRFSGFTGITNYMGAKFVTHDASLKSVFAELKRRGLTYADDGSAARSRSSDAARQAGIGFARGAATIDAVPTPQRIDEALAALETEAEKSGAALGIASALPISVERLARWAKAVERKGFILVPVSAVMAGEK